MTEENNTFENKNMENGHDMIQEESSQVNISNHRTMRSGRPVHIRKESELQQSGVVDNPQQNVYYDESDYANDDEDWDLTENSWGKIAVKIFCVLVALGFFALKMILRYR